MALLKDVMEEFSLKLKEKGFVSPRLDVDLLLSHVSGFTREKLYAYSHEPLDPLCYEKFFELFARRLAGEPIAYLVGKKEFMGMDFEVTHDVLIPRPDTEIMVELLVKEVQEKMAGNPQEVISILEIGTGSGCIPISIAKFCPQVRIESWDKSERALQLAEQNARQNLGFSHPITFIKKDALSFENWSALKSQTYHFIISNPPYIGHHEKCLLSHEVLNFEPHEALFAEENGFAFHRKIVSEGRSKLLPRGKIVLEIGAGQADGLLSLFSCERSMDIEFIKDYNGIKRLALFTF